jgi:hypothetical protein
LNLRRESATDSEGRLPSGALGVVSEFDFPEHLAQNDALALLRGAPRLLGPAGVMFIKVPNGASPAVGDMFCFDLTHESLFSPSPLAQLPTLAGFSRCDVREVGPVPHGIRLVVRFALWNGVSAWHRLGNAIEPDRQGPTSSRVSCWCG